LSIKFLNEDAGRGTVACGHCADDAWERDCSAVSEQQLPADCEPVDMLVLKVLQKGHAVVIKAVLPVVMY
jgi:hypothetical protein